MFLLRRNLANFKQTFVLVGRSTYKRWTTQSSSDTLRRASTIAVESDAHHDLSVKSDGKILSLENNHYHVDWLRHNCQCPRCRDSFAGQRKVQLSDLEDLTITSAQMKDGRVEIVWNNGRTNHHEGFFPPGWLQANSYSQYNHTSVIDDSVPTPEVAEELPTINYKEIMNKEDKQLLHSFLKMFLKKGMFLIQGIPSEPGRIRDICARFASECPTAYGEIIDLVAHARPTEPGFSQAGLPKHTDLTYYTTPPGLGFLSCVRFDDKVIGGESTLLDILPVVEEMRKHQKHFSSLTRIPATFIPYKWGDPYYLTCRNPHLEMDSQGHLKIVRWNPNAEAPLHAYESDVQDYYEAYKFLTEKINNAAHVLKHRLQSGEALMVNNHRVLHGREPYTLLNQTHGRHVQVLFGNLDDVKSTYRSLSQDSLNIC